jgi:ubiquinone/menaquinone biosynthesis C-methylase UbiE
VSKYEDYDKISATYDRTRRALGVHELMNALARGRAPLSQQTVLDAGCGTGNFALALRDEVGRIVCADYSLGMLNRCREKLSGGRGAADLVRCDLAELPFRAGLFDAIMCNQSLHHLDEPGTGFPDHRRFLAHARRVLRTDGLLIINTITHEQLRDGVWWGELIKPAVDRMTERFASVDRLKEMSAEAGFQFLEAVVPITAVMQPEGYLDPRSLHSAEFRSGDSHFSLLTAEELEAALARLGRMESDGSIHAYICRREEARARLGQSIFVIARKAG